MSAQTGNPLGKLHRLYLLLFNHLLGDTINPPVPLADDEAVDIAPKPPPDLIRLFLYGCNLKIPKGFGQVLLLKSGSIWLCTGFNMVGTRV